MIIPPRERMLSEAIEPYNGENLNENDNEKV